MTHPPRMGRINPTQNDGQYYKSAYVTGALIGQSEDATSRLSFDDRVAAERRVNDAPRSQWLDRRRRYPGRWSEIVGFLAGRGIEDPLSSSWMRSLVRAKLLQHVCDLTAQVADCAAQSGSALRVIAGLRRLGQVGFNRVQNDLSRRVEDCPFCGKR